MHKHPPPQLPGYLSVLIDWLRFQVVGRGSGVCVGFERNWFGANTHMIRFGGGPEGEAEGEVGVEVEVDVEVEEEEEVAAEEGVPPEKEEEQEEQEEQEQQEE